MHKFTKFKAVLAVVMVVAMMAALTVTAFASSGTPVITITPNDQDGVGEANRFQAYQIFTGTVESTDEEGRTLSHIEWGANINGSALVGAMKADPVLGEKFQQAYAEWESTSANRMSDAELVAHFIADPEGTGSANAAFTNAFARLCEANKKDTPTDSTRAGDSGGWTITVPAPGYYLVVDTIAETVGTKGTTSSYILDVVFNREIKLKASIPVATKKIEAEVGTDKGAISETGEANTFTYTLTGTLPDNYDEYKSYKYTFKDVLSKGITVDDSSVEVKLVNSDEGTVLAKADNTYSVSLTGGEGADSNLTITFPDLKNAAVTPTVTKDTVIQVTYTGHLNQYAVAGEVGNKNKVSIEYSNNPYDDEDTGKSVEVETTTYEIGLAITKKDGSASEDKNLDGAEFVLMNEDGQEATLVEQDGHYVIESWVAAESGTKVQTKNGGKLDIQGLGIGTYTLKETQAPAGYDAMEDIIFEVKGTVKDTGELNEDVDITLTAENETRDDAEFTVSGDAGIFDVTLTNYAAAVLPHTGGIGTIMFYIIGACVALAGISMAVIYFRKKSSNNA